MNAFNRQIINHEPTLQVSKNKIHLCFLNINVNLELNDGFITDTNFGKENEKGEICYRHFIKFL